MIQVYSIILLLSMCRRTFRRFPQHQLRIYGWNIGKTYTRRQIVLPHNYTICAQAQQKCCRNIHPGLCGASVSRAGTLRRRFHPVRQDVPPEPPEPKMNFQSANYSFCTEKLRTAEAARSIVIQLKPVRSGYQSLSALRTALSITVAPSVQCSTELNSFSQWERPSLL